MSEYLKSNWVLLLSFLFIMANSALIALEEYWFSLIPFALVIFLLAFVALDKLMWVIVFTTPLSLNLEELEFGGIGMFLPTEPLMFGVMVIFFLRLLHDKYFDRKVLRHPITIAIFIHLSWLLVTTLTSTMPLVSIKFLLSRLWFITTFYFVGTQLFKEQKNIRTFFWLFLISLCGVILYSLIHHYLYDFAERPAHWVMQPFFKDHTVYGAVVSMFLPIVVLMLILKRYRHYRLVMAIVTLIFLLGIIFSYGRAAWISVAGAAALYFVIVLRLRATFVFSVAGLVAIFLFTFWGDIISNLEDNNQDSVGDNLSEHVQSISNISSDASNLERLNRWNSAFRMFQEKPIFGWGPGTYSFQYAPFQSAEDLTIISTNAGDMGNAHSEFIGPLAEAGVFGPITFLLIVILFYYRGAKLYSSLPRGELRTIVLFTILAFSTYIINGILNNFLDTDKASVPFWGFVAIIATIDLFHKNRISEESATE